MFAQILPPDLQTAVLKHLRLVPGKPDLHNLNQLVAAYNRTVPWESAFRIAKRGTVDDWRICARWSEEFWEDNVLRGGGGTCFESNYAFSALLNGLGYDGYLTINNMDDSIGCHTAVVVLLDGQKWLVDAGFPLYAPLHVDPSGVSECDSSFQQYTILPDGSDRYQIERRPHPSPYAFTLIDRPVSVDEYRQAATADYGPNGHFLQRIVVHKIVDEQMWRFNSSEGPPQLSRFENGQRFDHVIEGDAATAVGVKFSIDETVVRYALDLIPAAELQGTAEVGSSS